MTVEHIMELFGMDSDRNCSIIFLNFYYVF